MSKDFLPSNGPALLLWSQNFSAEITSSPTAYSLVAAQATAYAALHAAYSAALTAAADPGTRTRAAISTNSDAKKVLRAKSREYARIIQATPTLTNAQRINLGLTPRGTESSPINPPTQVADLKVVSAISRVLKVSVRDPESDGRGKPDGVAGVTCFSFVGDEAPAHPAEWTYEGQSTRTNFDVIFPATVPAGAKVWLCCAWYNPRGQTGPLCNPVAAYLAGGMAAAA